MERRRVETYNGRPDLEGNYNGPLVHNLSAFKFVPSKDTHRLQ